MFRVCSTPHLNDVLPIKYDTKKISTINTFLYVLKSANNIQNNKNVWKKIDYLVLTFSKKIKKPYYKK